MGSLAGKKCSPCRAGAPPLPVDKVQSLLRDVPGWSVRGGLAIEREFVMKDFMAAVRLVNAVAETAEAEDHHPDIHLTGYRRLRIELSTHSVGGLSENDFIMAAKIEALPKELKA